MTEINNHAAVGILQSERDTALEHAERLATALAPFVDCADHTRVFLTTREKMHETGVRLYDEEVNDARSALAAYNAWRLA